MTGQQLRNSILQEAIQGRLVPNVLQPGEKTGAELLQSILAERQKKEIEEKGKKAKKLSLSVIEEEPWELPEGWCWCRVIDLCELSDATKITGEYVNMDAAFLRGKNSGTIMKSGRFVKAGSRMILVDGENSGEVFIAPCDGYLGSTFKELSIYIPACASYLLHFLTFNKDLFRNNKKGAAIPHLNKDIFRNLEIPLPPLSIQQAIVERIEALFPLVDEYDKAAGELKALNEALPDKLRKSVLQEAIHGNLVPNEIPEGEATAQELLQHILKERQDRENAAKGKKAKKLTLSEIEEEPWELPEGWCWCKLSDCLDVRDGTHDSPTYLPSGYPLITSKDFCDGRFNLSKTKYISEADYQKICIRSRVDIGDILYSMIGGNIGNMLIVNANNYMAMAIKNVALFKQYPGHRIDIHYVAAFLTHMKPIYQAMASGGAQPFIGLDVFRNTEIPLPPFSIQKAIVAKIEEVFAEIDKLKA